MQKRVFTTEDKFDVDIEISHYGAEPITNAVALWKIVDDKNATVANGEFSTLTIPIGKNTALGKVSIDLSKLTAPREYKLVVGIKNTEFENDWNFWLYPSKTETAIPKDVFVTSS